MMRILRSDHYRRMPWKNGGGETLEIAVFPYGAGMDHFGWRISMAHVATDGPFSCFPSVDRSLLVLEGEGIRLDIAGSDPQTLFKDSPPFAFPADKTTASALINGPITDLNIMTRRGCFAHEVSVFSIDSWTQFRLASSCSAIVCTEGEWIIERGRQREVMPPFDTILCESPPESITAKGQGTLILIKITALSA